MLMRNGLDLDAPETWPASYQRAHAYSPAVRVCCVSRLLHDPPTRPHQECASGHPLPWFDADDPERGFFDADHPACLYCAIRPMSDRYDPYCGKSCALRAEGEA